MKFYVKEWNDKTVSLMTENGNVLGYFPSIFDALTACEEWYMYNNNEPRHEIKVHSHTSAQPFDTDYAYHAA